MSGFHRHAVRCAVAAALAAAVLVPLQGAGALTGQGASGTVVRADGPGTGGGEEADADDFIWNVMPKRTHGGAGAAVPHA
jgi:hypothetical protein